ncbi:MAG: DUF512 domain-containing protein [Anaerolineae bacterium]
MRNSATSGKERKSTGGVIASVSPGTIADELGWRPGDVIISINGHILRDVIDFQFYGAEEELEIVLRRGGEEMAYQIERDYDEELGVKFTHPTFDGLRSCKNNCLFCFVDGMPPGLRPSLYLKDDDYRYSFLFGNFITLTNLSENDWERLSEQRLSPLYISVHATDPALRRRLFGRKTPDILAQIRRLGEIGIQAHAQIVLIPGLNDGPALERTVFDLAALYPTVLSIAVVPVGLTRYHRHGLRHYRAGEAGPILEQISSWQEHFRRSLGLNLVYAADEWYLLAGRPLPPAEKYDGFPQLENGVGLTRTFLDDWHKLKSHLPFPITLVCGTLIAPLMEEVCREWAGEMVEVVPVVNRFFGPEVTVSGLLTGEDVVEALRGRRLGRMVLLPRAMFDSEGELTLDDLGVEDIAEALGLPVCPARRPWDPFQSGGPQEIRSSSQPGVSYS